MPAASAALVYSRGMNQRNKTGFAFGSYGWGAKGGADQVEEIINQAGWKVARPVLKRAYRPTPERGDFDLRDVAKSRYFFA
jgi:flavorubredoxin